ncbi:putative mitochondrial hypothetical protein [Leptomonas pyrrhocoris]|uniref:tRNA:m(4)X modification enzyme TRM13 n=1 Tax=Leptomonas pyrrhocoris TaxID=157538 RepID=A0A0N0DUL1_LEPPY|nr:putative mitochondrial hypothetical protein [Leptomonas pyrrhocoris]XP_015657503.1 putative mitochondrial hypothetical protein [Leptomonas pyrrhocoris]XP_015657504.1 putative mitochondrial hypothetical protein [Leptomonas pyrrhocoris]KPA79063.1 putative mitochondrial hypothetical protein [Leptomonas pyrrhocoris]KPA79064.1 putative mitochondrial hypothetical protein [Leptomonas pyrrhocoris]KPA79065.1 putative mitochondrial hypothetical protein [Leptomonas pyrrhocoris]|eukprot:XP_015657502.1 putative mitochondrial hypothetical protein [Leptomonas pyrrhocoris]
MPSVTTSPSPRRQRPPTNLVNYRCKQKQYHSVLWSLQFLLSLLRHRQITDADAASSQSHTASSGVTSSSHCDGASSAVGAHSLRAALQQFLATAEGVDASFDAEGPLSAMQLLSLQRSFTDDQVRALCVECLSAYVLPQRQQQQQRVSLARPVTYDSVFAAPTELMQTLWPTPAFRLHYTTALAEAHRHRINHSDLLALPGYLQEAGLHAERVFTGQTAMDEPSCFTDPSEFRAAEEWRRLIHLYTAFLPDRSHIHELENLPQEVAIGELLRDAVAAVRRGTTAANREDSEEGREDAAGAEAFALDCVVDVGGGNGFLAAQVAERLHCDAVVVDPFFPAHAIDCCPRVWPDTPHRTHAATRRRHVLHRTTALFRDVRWADVVPAAPARTALIAKHLCGSGVDEVLQQLEAQGCLPRILVLAPCCFHRCSLDTYVDPPFVSDLLRLHTANAFQHLTRLTDWNASVYQKMQDGGATSAAQGAAAFTSKKSIRHLVSCPEGIAAAVEAVVNQGRVQWLQQRGYVVRLAEYVPDCVTPKNRCLVAYRPNVGGETHKHVS